MKLQHTLIGFALSFIFVVQGPILAQSASYSMFSDRRARNVGDVITILVVEYSEASSEATTTTEKENDHGFKATGGSGSKASSPLYGISGDLNNRYEGNATVSRQGQLKTKITATVTEVLPNGDLQIQGSRLVEVNGEREMATITGLVRQEDISGSNTVYSYQLADAQISYKGKGVVSTGQRPGVVARVFNWIF